MRQGNGVNRDAPTKISLPTIGRSALIRSLYQSTIGILGFGEIGVELARIVKGLEEFYQLLEETEAFTKTKLKLYKF